MLYLLFNLFEGYSAAYMYAVRGFDIYSCSWLAVIRNGGLTRELIG